MISLLASDLDGHRLTAVAKIWQQQSRCLEVSFGGVSMLPSIQPGEPLHLLCGWADVIAGDVIAFVFNDQIAVHRIIARDRDWIVTSGDAHWIPDVPVRLSSIIGTVVRPDGSPIPLVRHAEGRRRVFSLLLAVSVPSTRLLIIIATLFRNVGRRGLGAAARLTGLRRRRYSSGIR